MEAGSVETGRVVGGRCWRDDLLVWSSTTIERTFVALLVVDADCFIASFAEGSVEAGGVVEAGCLPD